MSLTAELRAPASPVRAWFSQRLPHTAPIVRAANRQLRGEERLRGGRVLPLSDLRTDPLIPAIGDRALVGHAVDWLLRLSLVDEPPNVRSAAGAGAARLADLSGSGSALVLFDEIAERCRELDPSQHALGRGGWLLLCRLCLLLGWLERAGRVPFAAPTVIDRVGAADGVDGWSAALIDAADLDDLDQLGLAAVADHADLRDRRPIVANPTFALSAALGGADGDVIAGFTLLDFKSTATSRIVTGQDLWQVLGYALADATDEYGIAEVGVSALRWRTRVCWPLEELLTQLAGGPLDLPTARNEFADVVTGARDARRRARRTRRERG